MMLNVTSAPLLPLISFTVCEAMRMRTAPLESSVLEMVWLRALRSVSSNKYSPSSCSMLSPSGR